MSIETIPPLIAAAPRVPSGTVLTEPPAAVVNTTLRGATGETVGHSRPWRGGAILVVFAVAVIGLIAFIATRDRATTAANAPAALDAAPAPPSDAAPLAITPDAAPAVVPPDAAVAGTTRPGPGSAKKLRPSGGAAKSGSGSAKTGAGSNYDPYDDR
jgi:hypothetical protein